MIVHFYWCYFSYFLHPFSFTNSFCTNSSTKKNIVYKTKTYRQPTVIRCWIAAPNVNQHHQLYQTQPPAPPSQTKQQIVFLVAHVCVRACLLWLAFPFLLPPPQQLPCLPYNRATTVIHAHNKNKPQKKPRSQLFEQDIGPLKRSLSAKSRRLSRIADLALVTLKKHYFLFRMLPTLDLHTCVRPPLDSIFSHWKITKTSEIGYFLSLCFMFLACILASFVLFEFDSLTLQY